MSIALMSVRPAKEEEWASIWEQCDYATYFHSPEWARIWQVYTEGRVRSNSKLVTFSDGKTALLPLSCKEIYKGLVTKNLSSPAGTFGGWISTDDLEIAHATCLGAYMTKELGDLVWRANPYDRFASEIGASIGTKDVTHALELSTDFEAILKGWKEGHRRAARKARREGVTVRSASTLEDWRAYYEVYEDSLRRWGNTASSIYGWKIFNEMFRQRSSKIRLWLSLYEEKLVAGALCVYSKRHVAYWHGAALEDYFHLRPVNLLMYEAIKDACDRGYAWFDFNPSGEHEGVRVFKRKFGARELECPVVSTETRRTRLIRKLLSIGQK